MIHRPPPADPRSLVRPPLVPSLGRALRAFVAFGLVVLVLLVLAGEIAAHRSAAATADTATGHALRMLGHTRGRLRDVGLSGTHAVMAIDGDLAVIDVRAPDAPLEVARLPLGLAVYRVLARGDRAYAAGDGVVWVVDIADPLRPAVLGSAPLPQDAVTVDLAFTGDRLFVLADRGSGNLRVFDVADPARPRDLGRAPGTYVDIDADNGLVVAVGFEQQVGSTFDVFAAAALPAAVPAGRIGADVLRTVAHVAVSGGYGYALVVGQVQRLAVIDLADPTRPQLVSQVDLPQRWYGMSIRAHGSRVLVVDAWLLGVIDVARPSQPVVDVRTSVDLDPRPAPGAKGSSWMGVGVDGDTVVHGSDDTGLAVLTMQGAVPSRRGHFATPPLLWPSDLAVDGNDVFVADPNEGVLRVDVSDPAAPAVADRYESTIGQAVSVVAARDRLFALFWGSTAPFGGALAELDRDTTGLPIGDSVPFTSTVGSLAVWGDRAYVSSFAVGLVVVDVPVGGPFRKRGRFGSVARVMDLAVSGDVAYVADADHGLVLVDVADPAAPRELGRTALPGRARRLALAGAHVFITWEDTDIGAWHTGVVDVTNPTAPRLLPPIDVQPGALHVDAAQGCLYSAGGGALRAYDIGQPAAPRLLDALPTLPLGDMATAGERLFAASNELGVVTFGYDCAARRRAGRTAYLPYGHR